jgi:hypothetical protein
MIRLALRLLAMRIGRVTGLRMLSGMMFHDQVIVSALGIRRWSKMAEPGLGVT